MKKEIFQNIDPKGTGLTISMIKESLGHGNKVGDPIPCRAPDFIICRNKKEVEMAKKLFGNKLTKEEWCSYSKGVESVLPETKNQNV